MAAWGTPGGEYYAITANQLLARVSPAGVEAWPIPALALGLWGGTSRSLWLAGHSGYIARFQDGAFTRHDAGVEFKWAAAWASSDEHVFLAGRNGLSDGAIAEWDGVRWRVTQPAVASPAFTAIHGGATPDAPWAVDLAGALWHFEP
jgi:hypothetical protein